MELELIRTYHPNGTNGVIYMNGSLQCYSIELPWQDNRPQHSCIPEGRYVLAKRYNQKFGRYFLVEQVKDRSCILVHPANNALKELKGCIAPVSSLTGEGQGLASRKAIEHLCALLYPVMQKETVFITIKSDANEINRKSTGTDSGVL